MTKEQDAVKAKNKARPKCEYCDKPGYTELECRTLKLVPEYLIKGELTTWVGLYVTGIVSKA